jgi:hypothetical protein
MGYPGMVSSILKPTLIKYGLQLFQQMKNYKMTALDQCI